MEQNACDKLARIAFRTGAMTLAVGLIYGAVLNGPYLLWMVVFS